MKIKHLSKLLPLLLTFTLLFSLTACGGGGGGGGEDEDLTPTVKTAKVTIGIQRFDQTQGNNVGSVALDITLPTDFVLETTGNGPTTMTVLVSGLKVKEWNYTHPTLTLYLFKEDATAFSTGNLVSFTHALQSGEVLPVAGSFQVDLPLCQDRCRPSL